MPEPPPTITCVDCGDDAHLLSVSEADDGGERIAAYRCSGCWDRWDLVFDDPPSEEADGGHAVGPEPPTVEGEVEP